MVIFDGTSRASYRQVCAWYNRQVRQQEQGLRAESLRYESLVESRKIEIAQDLQCQAILAQHDFDEQGHPNEITQELLVDQTKVFNEQVIANFDQIKGEAPPQVQPHLALDRLDYENPDHTVYMAIDEVCNKKQKEHRNGTKPTVEACENTRKEGKKIYVRSPFLFHTVARIVAPKGNYTLTGVKLGSIWPLLMALLLDHQLMNHQWIFLVDGQQSLQNGLLARLKYKSVRLLLDWYHLRKKIHVQISKSLSTTKDRDPILLHLEQLAWYGLSQQAIDFIQKQIPQQLVKNQKELDKLAGYFQRSIDVIPNYALRKQLGLICSSNRVEKENDCLVAQRQKHNGMSWTRKGSDALANVTALKRNQEVKYWLDHQRLLMKLVA